MRLRTQRLCNNLERWEWAGAGKEIQEGGTCVYLWLIEVNV